MTRIDFHSNVANPLLYVCRLARKVYTAGAKLVITAETDQLIKLNEMLWTFSQIDFVPHCTVDDMNVAHTPIILSKELDALPHYHVLLNLSEQIPMLFARFERLIEIIGLEESVRLAARARYRFYRDRGYLLQTFDQTGIV